MTIDLVLKNHWTSLVIMSKKEQTNREKYVFYCSVSQIHINPEKTQKIIKMNVWNVPILAVKLKMINQDRMIFS